MSRPGSLPKQVDIDGEVWRVERPSTLRLPHTGEKCYGLCVFDTCTIKVVRHLGHSERAWATLRHEMCHARLFKIGALKFLERLVPDDTERLEIEDDLIDRAILPISWNMQPFFAKVAG